MPPAGLQRKLTPKSKATTQRSGPLWLGPCAEGPMGGVTQSMINAFLEDRERFRVKYVLGLRPPAGFSHILEYGQMWHTCEEAHAKGVEWGQPLRTYAESLMRKYPFDQQAIEKWYNACRMQFPIYCDYWKKHKDVKTRTPLMQEQVFDVPYHLPSGRIARLRGKFDAVDLIGKDKNAGIWLFENKTKGDVDEQQLRARLKFDLQTMMYLVALGLYANGDHTDKTEGIDALVLSYSQCIKGVRYNVIRRPFSGGRGNIKQLEATKNRAAETADEYWARLQQYFIDDPGYWFMRWNAEISPADVEFFKTRFLTPFLEHLCNWYDDVTTGDPFRHSDMHWVHPYGCVNMINEGYGRDADEYVLTGSEVGLVRVNTLFEELR